MNTLAKAAGVAVVVFCCGALSAVADELPLDQWEGFRGPVKGLTGQQLATVGYPAKQACALTFKGNKPSIPGAYRLRVKLASSHVCDEAAWGGSFEIIDLATTAAVVGGQARSPATFPAIHFSRAHQPEWRTVEWVHSGNRPLSISIVAHMSGEAFDAYGRENIIQQGGPTADSLAEPDAGDDLGDVLPELEVKLQPATSFYGILAAAEVQLLSASGVIDSVAVDKVLYAPGETLTASISAHSVAGQAPGKLQILLEWGLDSQEMVDEKPVTLGPDEQSFTVKIPLHKEELGHALVARFVSEDGKNVHERREYFSIAENFQRVAIPGRFGGLSFTMLDDARLKADIEGGSRDYGNYWEWFAWAEEDMVELTPETDFWFSGQTTYHNSKAGATRAVELAHERGVKVVTYGKFIMSGYLGWKFAYDNPYDCKAQFIFPVGFWEGTNVSALDYFQYKEFVPYTTPWFHPAFAAGSTFGSPFFQIFMPINPDPTPRMVKVAADEMIRAIEMFGFDGVRWDGHPRTGPYMESTKYNFRAQRATALLVRYFKDLVAAKHPGFRHGYNCLPLTADYNWAVENYELDELCRGGGLLMNEAQGNSTEGKTYDFRLKVLQADG
ncbi:MAG TPA: hypothetical protein VM186_01910, partial [Planctomycetota bacterium]|nr:hypothetical protein [Planctomycetota bacterium]